MAEGFARTMHHGRVNAASAGIERHGMNPRTIKVMMEAGIDIGGQHSKTIDDLGGQQFDFVATVCDHAKEVCPVWPAGGRALHHSFTDPACSGHLRDEEAILTVYRQVRDEIRSWVSVLPGELASL